MGTGKVILEVLEPHNFLNAISIVILCYCLMLVMIATLYGL